MLLGFADVENAIAQYGKKAKEVCTHVATITSCMFVHYKAEALTSVELYLIGHWVGIS